MLVHVCRLESGDPSVSHPSPMSVRFGWDCMPVVRPRGRKQRYPAIEPVKSAECYISRSSSDFVASCLSLTSTSIIVAIAAVVFHAFE